MVAQTMTARKTTPIRAISRALKVLQTVSRLRNPTMMEIARETDLPYPTVFRIMQTLIEEGMVEMEANRKRYRVTSLSQTLSHGFQEEDLLGQVSRPHIAALTKAYGWPVTLAVRVGKRMMVKESTHRLSTLTFAHYYPGYTLPLLDCASGKVFLAFSPPEDIDVLLQSHAGLEPEPDQGETPANLVDRRFLARIRAAGYAVQTRNQYTYDPGKTSSVAVPILDDGAVLGSLVLVFFASTLSASEAVARYVAPLNETAIAIADDFRREKQALFDPQTWPPSNHAPTLADDTLTPG